MTAIPIVTRFSTMWSSFSDAMAVDKEVTEVTDGQNFLKTTKYLPRSPVTPVHNLEPLFLVVWLWILFNQLSSVWQILGWTDSLNRSCEQKKNRMCACLRYLSVFSEFHFLIYSKHPSFSFYKLIKFWNESFPWAGFSLLFLLVSSAPLL